MATWFLLAVQGLAIAFAVWRSVSRRFWPGLGCALAILVIRAIAVPLATSFSILPAVLALIPATAVLAIAWRRKALLSPSSELVTQAEAVVPAFIALFVTNGAMLATGLFALTAGAPP